MQNHGVDPFGIVGQVLDAQFRVDRLVGEGGFSAVYRGHHLGLDEPIAIKCLKLPPALSPELVDQFAKRFRDESRILYRLSQGNLNIVRSMAAGTWQANTGAVVPYMILEWMEGRSLANELTIRRTIGKQGRSLEEVIELFESAADGLGYAHAQGVVHRDLNPGNLFLASTPQGSRMKVLDFGVAKILDESTLNIARTHTVGHIRIFAPAYGAPEQFDDAIGKVGAASDVYAFALILLEALRDRCVNEGTNLGDFAQNAIDPNRRPTPRTLGLDVPDEVEQIFARATRLDPRERWQNAGELWKALAIAASAASQQKHARAAMETPPLAMPHDGRQTKRGMAPPPTQGKPPGGPGLGKTLPIGSVMPGAGLPRPGTPGAPRAPEPPAVSRGPSSPRIPTAEGAPRPAPPSVPRVPARPSAPEPVAQAMPGANPPTQRFPGDLPPSIEPEGELPTRAGFVPPADGVEEPEDEVTRVRAPEPDVLRGLADIEARNRPAGLTSTQVSHGSSPRPAAGMAPGGSPMPPIVSPPPLPPDAPASGGTMMMAPGAHGQLPPMPSMPVQQEHARSGSGQHQLAQTMPLTGPHPLGMGGHHSGAGALAPPQAPPPQQPPQGIYPHAPHHPQHHPMLQPAPHLSVQTQGPAFAQPQHGARMDESVSMPPASATAVPKKNNVVVFALIGMGTLALIGIVLAVIVVVGGKRDATDKGSVASATASASTPIASAPVPPPPPPALAPPPVIEPAAIEEETVDASATAQVDDAPDASIAPVATAAPTATEVAPAPAPAPTPTPTVAPVPAPVKDPAPPPDPNAFNESAARSRLSQANGILVFCKKEGGVTGPGTAMVTFATDGTVSAVSLDPPYAGTPAGDCVTGHFKRTKVNPFQGSQQSVKHSFEVPK